MKEKTEEVKTEDKNKFAKPNSFEYQVHYVQKRRKKRNKEPEV